MVLSQILNYTVSDRYNSHVKSEINTKANVVEHHKRICTKEEKL